MRSTIIGLLPLALVIVLTIVPAWRILRKAGFAGAWSLLLLIPVVNFIATWVFAFKRWPVEGSNQRY